jgi:hypothetical protein
MQIIDNFLPEEDFNKLSETIMGKYFPWFYVEGISGKPPETENINCKDVSGFYHNVYNKYNGFISPSVEIFDALFVALEKIGYTSESLCMLRLGMLIPTEGICEDDYMIPHIDIEDRNHDTALFYVNDADGDTVFFNKVRGDNLETDLKVTDRVKPVRNRLVIFDGFKYHAASCPIETKRRVVLNLNLLPRK